MPETRCSVKKIVQSQSWAYSHINVYNNIYFSIVIDIDSCCIYHLCKSPDHIVFKNLTMNLAAITQLT